MVEEDVAVVVAEAEAVVVNVEIAVKVENVAEMENVVEMVNVVKVVNAVVVVAIAVVNAVDVVPQQEPPPDKNEQISLPRSFLKPVCSDNQCFLALLVEANQQSFPKA